MAHYRQGALAAADALPADAALAALGAAGDWAEIRAALHANPWWRPDPPEREGILLGGFTGFGGPFPQPPAVRGCAQGLLVRSGERTSLLVADAYGATLHPMPPEAFEEAPTPSPRLDGEGLHTADRIIALSLPLQGLSAAVAGDTVAVASAYSHQISVFPWRRP